MGQDASNPVTICFAADLDAAWQCIDASPAADGVRVIACRWAVVPRLDQLLDDVVQAFAKVALADWPQWYGVLLYEPAEAEGFEQRLHLRRDLANISRQQLHIVYTWLRFAAERCLRGELPYSKQTPLELQAAQLSLAVSPGQLQLILCGETEAVGGAAALLAAGEWFHRVTRAPLELLVPIAWKDSEALRRLNCPRRILDQPATTEMADAAAGGGMQLQVTPLAGRPHPGSDAEQALYRHVMADAELSGCLMFNQTIEADLRQKFRVDIVCQSLRIVVEVDGDDHRASVKYCDDCLRDYRLMLMGYLVLRLPNELVESDPELAVGRIRDLIRHRQNEREHGVKQ